MTVRVIRLMEYEYADLETAHRDMARWQVQGTYSPHAGMTIRSRTIVNPTPFEVPLPLNEEQVESDTADQDDACEYGKCDATGPHYHIASEGKIETVYT